MQRRDISKFLLTATGVTAAAALSQKGQAQSCTAPCYVRTPQEVAADVTPTNYAYQPGDVRRYGSDPTGSTDSTTAINNALKSNLCVYIPPGTYLISGSLIWQDEQYIVGAGYLNTIIKGDLSNASFFRSAYGERPSSGQRPLGVHISDLAIYPATTSTITSGSVGVNFRNAQYCTLERVLMQYVDTGVVTDQNGQFLRFYLLHVQVANTGLWSNGAIGGNNCISDCSFGARDNAALDIDGGAWDISKCDCTALFNTTPYCIRLGRPGGTTTVVHADKLYVEGVNTANVTLQIENSVNRSRVSMHRHNVLGRIINNAGEACMIEVPGQGYYNPVYHAQRVEFASSIDGIPLSSLIAVNGNQLQVQNSSDSGTGDIVVRNAALNGAANNPGVAGTVVLGNTVQGTVGPAGGSAALPSNPAGYLIAYVGTTKVVIPYYLAS